VVSGGLGEDRLFGTSGRDVATAGRRAKVSCGSGRDKVPFDNEEKRLIARDCEVRYEFSDRPRN